MAENKNTGLLRISDAPHIKTNDSVTSIMWTVVLALMPATIYSVWLFGVPALLVLTAGVVSAAVAEALFQKIMKQDVTVMDGSAVLTGLLIAMNVPPTAPVWVVAVGSFFGIIIVKQIFGGLGFNVFNPALAARAFLMASWPVYMTTGWTKFSGSNVLATDLVNSSNIPQKAFDALSQATPLGVLKEGPKILTDLGVGLDKMYDLLFSSAMLKSLFIGNVGGVIGETSAVLLLLGGIFLIFKRIITWHIPVAYIGTVAVMTMFYYSVTGVQTPYLAALFHVLSAGLILGAFFMATDMVTSPVTAKGMIIFGVGAGLLTFVIRLWGGYPEGVSYSILLMNAVTPLIDRYNKPKVFGVTKTVEEVK